MNRAELYRTRQTSAERMETQTIYIHTCGNREQVEEIRAGQTIRPERNTGGKGKFSDTRGGIGFQNKTGSHETEKAILNLTEHSGHALTWRLRPPRFENLNYSS